MGISISDARKLLTPSRNSQLAENAPDFCKNWIWLNDRDRFYNVDTKEEITKQSFDANFTRKIMGDDTESGNIGAANFALNNNHIPCFSRAVYMPQNQQFFELDGVQCVNSFSVNSLPETPNKITPEAMQAIQPVIDHIANLCGKREKETQWLLL